MTLPRVSIKSFLNTAKTALKNAEYKSASYAVVIGNESADLDSLFSAIVFSYIRTYAPSSNTFYIPLSNLQSADLSLRPELLPVLKYAGLSLTDLLTLEDLGLPPTAPKVQSSRWWKTSTKESASKDDSRWILVDHNNLTGRLGEIYSSNVVGCVDHHDDEGTVPSKEECEKAGQPRVIQKCGSCMSLVVSTTRKAWDELAAPHSYAEAAARRPSDVELKHWNHELARLCLAPVLIDTHNLQDEIKTTDTDREAYRYLEGWMAGAGKGYDSNNYFDEISTAKSDIGGLCLEDILRKDFKMWVEPHKHGDFKLGISSVVKPVCWLVEKAGSEQAFKDVVEKFREDRGLDLQAVMMSYTSKKGNFKRELFVLGKGKKGVKVAERFEGAYGENLKLKLREMMNEGGKGEGEKEGDKHTFIRCWKQGDVAMSRKQVGPLMREAVKK